MFGPVPTYFVAVCLEPGNPNSNHSHDLCSFKQKFICTSYPTPVPENVHARFSFSAPFGYDPACDTQMDGPDWQDA